MADLNEYFCTGNLGKDPKMTRTKTNKARCTVTLGVGNVEKTSTGEFIKHTTWFNLIGWEKTAELMATLKKGQAVFVKGSLKQKKFKGDDGTDKEFLELMVRRIDPIDRSAFGNSSVKFSEEEIEEDIAEEPAF